MRANATIFAMILSGSLSLVAQQPAQFMFDSHVFEFQEGRTVKGAPYSATAISTSIQTLGDGTRITRTSEAQLARDSEGRTRREQGIDSVGPWTAKEQHIVSINDPVAQVRYTLRPDTQTAAKVSAKPVAEFVNDEIAAKLKRTLEEVRVHGDESHAKLEDAQKMQARAKEVAERMAAGFTIAGPKMTVQGASGTVTLSNSTVGGPFTVILGNTEKGTSKNEELGEKMIEGVKAKGRRESRTIAIGEIGNDRPIEIASESWYSDELQTVVYSKRSDPRVGETEYRLTNVSRAEPSRSLFEVPAGYTMKEDGKRRD